jgi:hypothetical protein
MKAADDLRILRSPWRSAAMCLLAAAVVVATASLVLDGGRPAMAAGDCQYGPYASTCEKARPTLTTMPQSAPPIGSFHFDIVALSGGTNPTGTIRFRLYEPDDPSCANAVFDSTATVRGQNGPYASYEGPATGSAQATSGGTWRWVVSYSGDAANEPATLECGSYTVFVAKAAPFVVASIDPGPLPLGTSLMASTTVQGAFQPTGTVALRLFGPGDVSCATPLEEKTFVAGGFGPYQATFTPTSLGTWRVVAAYSGDDANASASSACGNATTEVVVPPANDDFADAVDVGRLPFTDSVNTGGASREPNEPFSCSFSSRTVWYAFTPDDDVRVTLSLSGLATVAVFAASRPGLDGLSFVSCGTGTVGLERGVTYYFRVDGASFDPVTFGLDQQPQPNDEPSGARAIPSPRYSDSDDSRYATSSPTDPSCFGGGDTVWYAFTPTQNMRLEAAVQPWYSDQASRFTLSAYVRSGGDFQSLDCSDDSLVVSGYRKPHIEFDATAGETVYLMIGTSGGTAGGGYYFSLQRPLDVPVTVDAKGATVTKDGVAAIGGTVACSRASSTTLWITLDQVFAGRQRANGFAWVSQVCGPKAQSWSVALTSFPILFGSGRAEVTLQVPPACDDQGCQPGALYDESSYSRSTVHTLTLSRQK